MEIMRPLVLVCQSRRLEVSLCHEVKCSTRNVRTVEYRQQRMTDVYCIQFCGNNFLQKIWCLLLYTLQNLRGLNFNGNRPNYENKLITFGSGPLVLHGSIYSMTIFSSIIPPPFKKHLIPQSLPDPHSPMPAKLDLPQVLKGVFTADPHNFNTILFFELCVVNTMFECQKLP